MQGSVQLRFSRWRADSTAIIHPESVVLPGLDRGMSGGKGVEDLALYGASFDHPGGQALAVPH